MCSLAALIALSCTNIPATQPIPGESGLLEDFEVQGDLSAGSPVKVKDLPLFITVSKVNYMFILLPSRLFCHY